MVCRLCRISRNARRLGHSHLVQGFSILMPSLGPISDDAVRSVNIAAPTLAGAARQRRRVRRCWRGCGMAAHDRWRFIQVDPRYMAQGQCRWRNRNLFLQSSISFVDLRFHCISSADLSAFSRKVHFLCALAKRWPLAILYYFSSWWGCLNIRVHLNYFTRNLLTSHIVLNCDGVLQKFLKFF